MNNPEATVDQHRAAAERSEALIARLGTTIDALLAGARARAESTGQVDNDLMTLITRVVDQQRVLRPDRRVHVTGAAVIRVGIDGPSVQRALAYLLDNATRHPPPSEPVRFDVTEHRPTLSGEAGAGIGLALVKRIADAHGVIEATSPLPGFDYGTRFTIILR